MGLDKVEVGRLFGIPILLDASFILLIVIYGQWYFTSADMSMMSYGLLLVTGIALSILAHEFGHALAARYYGVATSHIELNGLGGLCYYERSPPPGRLANIIILLAGPVVTGALWLFCDFTRGLLLAAPDQVGELSGVGRLAGLVDHIGFVNWVLLCFNLLPSHPLDGGRALVHLISRWTGYDRAMRFIAFTGMLVIAWLIYEGVNGNYFSFVVAYYLFLHNKLAAGIHGGPRWTRWN